MRKLDDKETLDFMYEFETGDSCRKETKLKYQHQNERIESAQKALEDGDITILRFLKRAAHAHASQNLLPRLRGLLN